MPEAFVDVSSTLLWLSKVIMALKKVREYLIEFVAQNKSEVVYQIYKLVQAVAQDFRVTV